LPAAADTEPLSPAERGMLATVAWQRNHAAAAYLEIEYDPRPWDAAAAAFRQEHRLLASPMLSLMAHQLARIAPELGANGTVLEDGSARRVRYRQVNLGFTVQAGERLYLCVVEAAETLSPKAFVDALFKLQQRAMGHKLTPAEMTGATVGFSSMARATAPTGAGAEHRDHDRPCRPIRRRHPVRARRDLRPPFVVRFRCRSVVEKARPAG
jgi:pyruvate/2-oxoglutarate dehydrogenase complex dihydrolipoamide acyltransferase (E2) component